MRGGLQREQTPGPVQVAVQWRHSPPSGPHGSTPQRTPSSSWQSPPESSLLFAFLQILFICQRACSVCVCVCVRVCSCVCVFVCVCMCDNVNVRYMQGPHNSIFIELCTFQKFDGHCVRRLPSTCLSCDVPLGWC